MQKGGQAEGYSHTPWPPQVDPSLPDSHSLIRDPPGRPETCACQARKVVKPRMLKRLRVVYLSPPDSQLQFLSINLFNKLGEPWAENVCYNRLEHCGDGESTAPLSVKVISIRPKIPWKNWHRSTNVHGILTRSSIHAMRPAYCILHPFFLFFPLQRFDYVWRVFPVNILRHITTCLPLRRPSFSIVMLWGVLTLRRPKSTSRRRFSSGGSSGGLAVHRCGGVGWAGHRDESMPPPMSAWVTSWCFLPSIVARNAAWRAIVLHADMVAWIPRSTTRRARLEVLNRAFPARQCCTIDIRRTEWQFPPIMHVSWPNAMATFAHASAWRRLLFFFRFPCTAWMLHACALNRAYSTLVQHRWTSQHFQSVNMWGMTEGSSFWWFNVHCPHFFFVSVPKYSTSLLLILPKYNTFAGETGRSRWRKYHLETRLEKELWLLYSRLSLGSDSLLNPCSALVAPSTYYCCRHPPHQAEGFACFSTWLIFSLDLRHAWHMAWNILCSS